MLKKLTHKTTKEHYEKYRDLAIEARVTLKNSRDFLGYRNVPCNQSLAGKLDGACFGCWRCKWMIDKALNCVPLHIWDMMVYSHWGLHGRSVVKTLAEGVSMYKHLVVYEIVGAEPEFVDSWFDTF